MKRRLLWLALVVPVVVSIVLAIQHQTEPAIRGRTLSEWLIAAKNGGEAERMIAKQAIKEFGTNALPFLIREMQTKPSLQERLEPWWVRTMPPQLWFDCTHAEDRRDQAVLAFSILETNAASALPQLRRLFTDERLVEDAAIAIEQIKTTNAMEVLVPLLSHPNPRVRARTILGLGSFEQPEHLAKVATAQLIRAADDPDEETARSAVFVIAETLPVESATRVLTNKFKDHRHRVVQGAIGGFFGAGPLVEPAMPAIAAMLTNSDEKTRRVATNTLLTINPYRALEFGVSTNDFHERHVRLYRMRLQNLATNGAYHLRQVN
jgi:HEAT repeat protein